MEKIDRRDFLKLLGASSLFTLFDPSFSMGIDGNSIPVLLYHEISYRPLTDYTVRPHEFLAQMEFLRSYGFKTIFPWEAEKSFIKGDRAIIITFDDGSYTFLEYAYPILKEYKMKAIMNIIGSQVSINFNMITWDEYRDIMEDGLLEIGCHSYDFHFPGWSKKISLEEFRNDLIMFKKVVWKELKREVTIFSSPLGEQLTEAHLAVLTELGFNFIMLSEESINKRIYYSPLQRGKIIYRLNINYKISLTGFRDLISYPYRNK